MLYCVSNSPSNHFNPHPQGVLKLTCSVVLNACFLNLNINVSFGLRTHVYLYLLSCNMLQWRPHHLTLYPRMGSVPCNFFFFFLGGGGVGGGAAAPLAPTLATALVPVSYLLGSWLGNGKCTCEVSTHLMMIIKLQDTVLIYLKILLTRTQRTVWKQARRIHVSSLRLQMSHKD